MGNQGEQPCPANRVGAYMAFQPVRFIPLRHCCRTACALTARFHLYHSLSRGSLVSVTLSVPAVAGKPHPLDGTALCVVRTFLISAVAEPRQGGLQLYKYTKFVGFFQLTFPGHTNLQDKNDFF